MKRLIPLFIITLLCISGCGQRNVPYTATGYCFDTVISFSFYGKNAKNVINDCMELAAHYDDLWNKNKKDSEVFKINSSKGETVTVSDETAELIALSLDIAALSDGAVTPLIGSVSSLWDFKSETPIIPEEKLIKEGLRHIHYSKIDLSGNRITLSDPDSMLDLGFIAKGYAADKLKELAVSEGITSGWINLGGNVLVIGERPDHTAFNIGIQDPQKEGSGALFSVPVSDLSVVTSGVYERCFTVNDTLFFHILDTKTGYPVRNNLLSVTVIGPSSAICDALSTTLFVMGYDQGRSFISGFPDYEAYFITNTAEILKTD